MLNSDTANSYTILMVNRMARRILTQEELDERKLMSSLKRLARRVNIEKAKVSPEQLRTVYDRQLANMIG